MYADIKLCWEFDWRPSSLCFTVRNFISLIIYLPTFIPSVITFFQGVEIATSILRRSIWLQLTNYTAANYVNSVLCQQQLETKRRAWKLKAILRVTCIILISTKTMFSECHRCSLNGGGIWNGVAVAGGRVQGVAKWIF